MPFTRILALLSVLLFCFAGVCAQGDARERELRELKDLYDKGLITQAVYERRAAEILRGAAGGVQGIAERISGTWFVRVEPTDSVFDPGDMLEMQLGVHWRIAVINGRLSISQYSAGFDYVEPADGSLRGAPFEPLNLTDEVLEENRIAFKVKGHYGAYVAYDLTYFRENEISGKYVAVEPYGPPGVRGEHASTVILERRR